MAPKVQRDMPEERHQSSLAIKQEVPFPNLVAELKKHDKVTADQQALLDGYLAKYEKKIFTGPAAFTVTKMTVGLTACKDCFSILCPGFMNDHHPATHEHPPVV
jgi:hypothetical protein